MSSALPAYYPSDLDEKHFWAAQLDRKKSNVDIPSGFPTRLDSSLSWTVREVEKRQSRWKLDLNFKEIAAIDAALESFETEHDDLSLISASTFQLPSEFSQRLREVSDNLYKGDGFQIIHGLDPSRYTPRQNIIVYAGVSSHICPERGFVDAANGVIGHVVNVQDGVGGRDRETTAPAFSNIPLSFHTDNCEILSFYHLESALKGGQTTLSSSWHTYNELAANQPEVLHTLTEPWVMDTFKSNKLMAPYQVSLLQRLSSNQPPVLFRFSRYPITGWQRKRNPKLPPPTQAQIEAVDAVQFTAMKNAIKLPVVKGDMIYVNDMAVFHAREGFEGSGMRRHLLKMYLRDPDQGWGLPKSIENEWKSVYNSNSQDTGKQEVWNTSYKTGLEELQFVNG